MDKNENFENVSEEVVEASVATAVETTADDLHGENLNDRVRVLSPGMMVAKRFFRSKLSITGIVILALLFTFCWLGPVFYTQWGETETDRTGAIVYTEFETVGEDGPQSREPFILHQPSIHISEQIPGFHAVYDGHASGGPNRTLPSQDAKPYNGL